MAGQFTKFEVGQQVCSPSQDGIQFDFTDAGATLLVKFSSPSSKEKQAIKNGAAQFKFVVKENILFFLARFGTEHWIDAPFHTDYCLAQNLELPAEGMGCTLHIILVDAATGVLVVQRLIGLSTSFSVHLLEAAMALVPNVSKMDYAKRLNSVYTQCTTQDLVQEAQYSN